MKKFLLSFVFIFIFTFTLAVSSVQIDEMVYKSTYNFTNAYVENSKHFPANFETTSDWRLVLVNQNHALTEEYPVVLGQSQGFSVDERIVADLNEMISDAKKAGFNLKIYSSYRTFEGSKVAFNRKVNELTGGGMSLNEATNLTKKWIAPPGESEHNTGLALDIISSNYFDDHDQLDHSFENFEEYTWLINHCAEYGFIIRYPKDKQDITQITFEPWHYRYVGRDHAGYIMEEKICLEEYLAILSEAVENTLQ